MMKPTHQPTRKCTVCARGKKWRTDTLDALLSDTKNRASKPLETLNTQLALYITDVTNEAVEGEEDEPSNKGELSEMS